MTIELTGDQQKQIEEQVSLGRFPTPDALVREAVTRLLEEEAEAASVRQAVAKGLEQAERGELRPAEEVFAELRAKHGIPN